MKGESRLWDKVQSLGISFEIAPQWFFFRTLVDKGCVYTYMSDSLSIALNQIKAATETRGLTVLFAFKLADTFNKAR